MEDPDIQATALEEPDILATASEESDNLATGLAEPAATSTKEPTSPPTLLETDKKVQVAPAHELPSWIEILPSHPVIQVG